MPEIGYWHPQLVHFAVVLGIVGALFRLISLTGKFSWTGSAARAILIPAGLVGWLTARSGHDAHGPVERIPGAVNAVVEHEEWGDRARNALMAVAALELIGLALGQRKVVGAIRLASGLAGVGAMFALYEAAEHGGELVYEYAGGPGIRSGDSTDVTRLLVAGLYSRAMADRASGDKAGAARLFEELGHRMPNDQGSRLLVIESTLKDRGDGPAALEALRGFEPGDDRRAQSRRTFLLADAYKAVGFADSARMTLEAYKRDNPGAAARIDQAIKALTDGPQ